MPYNLLQFHLNGKTNKLYIVPGPHGKSVPPDATVEVSTGSGYLVRFVPDNGYVLRDVLVNGKSRGSQRDLFIPRIDADVKVEAVMQLAHYSHLSRSLYLNKVDPVDPRVTPQHSGITLSFTAEPTPGGSPSGLKVELFNDRSSLSFTWGLDNVALEYKGEAGSGVYRKSTCVPEGPLSVVLKIKGASVVSAVIDASGSIVTGMTATLGSGSPIDLWKVSVDSWDIGNGGGVSLGSITMLADDRKPYTQHRGSGLNPPGTRRVPELD